MFTSFSQRFLSTIKAWTQIKNKKKVWQIFPWFFYSPDYATLWIVKVFNLGAFYVLFSVFICLNFVWILNLQNNYTDSLVSYVKRVTFYSYLLAFTYFERKNLEDFKKIVPPTWKIHLHVVVTSSLRHSWFCTVFEDYD